MTIPKIIHQLWIGNKPSPINLMNTWKSKHPDFEYILWNENEILQRNIIFVNQSKIDEIEEINGKADIMRWEILQRYGGIFIDADSICIEKIDSNLLDKPCFAGWEHEKVRNGLIATGTMGFPPNHPLVRYAVEWISMNEVSFAKTNQMAWQTVGPYLLTTIYNSKKFMDLYIFPSYTFLPLHFTGEEYSGHGKIYSFQLWGSTNHSYDFMNSSVLPEKYQKPDLNVSVLICSYNTKKSFIEECLESIKHQIGYFSIEIVWINDGSNEICTKELKDSLNNFKDTTRFITIIYYENEKNRGISYSLHKGVLLCTNDIIFRMDSDDIMVHDRMDKQLSFMQNNKTIQICGGQVSFFKEKISDMNENTNHPSFTLNEYKLKKIHWLMNHPTLCFRKKAILEIGNYNPSIKMIEDFDLILRFLNHYGYIHNLKDIVLHYRIHPDQVTFNNAGSYYSKDRNKLIEKLII